MTPESVLEYCLETLDGVIEVNSWGERGIFYNPGRILKRGVYVLTVKEKDGENDCASCLDREGMWRLNIGLRKSTFLSLFGEMPSRPKKGGVVDMPFDFSVADTLCHTLSMRGWAGYAC